MIGLLLMATLASASEPSPLPELIAQAQKDARDPDVLAQWGRSVNFDEHAKAVIVDTGTLNALFAAAGVAPGHAGITHTYGYLTSTLVTPYGYKRDRWTSGVIEKGFGLPAGFLSPAPPTGTLLSNATAFARSIAFRGEERVRKAHFPALKSRRLTETAGDISIRTDIVPYLRGEGALLVYSWRDLKAKRSYLITMFPVDAKFADGLFDPAKLGEGKPIAARYNGDIPLLVSVGSRRAE